MDTLESFSELKRHGQRREHFTPTIIIIIIMSKFIMYIFRKSNGPCMIRKLFTINDSNKIKSLSLMG